jgi:hypothetical protein
VIVDGFDLASPLVCEGIVGDGCGGGRIFYIEDEKLFAYDPYSKARIQLLEELHNVISLSKKSCIIRIVCEDKNLEFDLSKLDN